MCTSDVLAKDNKRAYRKQRRRRLKSSRSNHRSEQSCSPQQYYVDVCLKLWNPREFGPKMSKNSEETAESTASSNSGAFQVALGAVERSAILKTSEEQELYHVSREKELRKSGSGADQDGVSYSRGFPCQRLTRERALMLESTDRAN